MIGCGKFLQACIIGFGELLQACASLDERHMVLHFRKPSQLVIEEMYTHRNPLGRHIVPLHSGVKLLGILRSSIERVFYPIGFGMTREAYGSFHGTSLASQHFWEKATLVVRVRTP